LPAHSQGGCGVSVTSCSVCGGPLEGKYANALTCSSRCRQKAYRLRVKGEAPRRCNGQQAAPTPIEELRRLWYALTPEERQEKRKEIAVKARKRAEAGLIARPADRELFRDDPGRIAA
jgi:hypothetical protein